jgi:hypothetical protein
MRPTPRLNPIPLFAATAGALLTLCIVLAAGPEEVIAALPLILLLVALVFKRYPGEELIERLSRRFHKRRPRPVSVVLPPHRAEPVALRLLQLLSGVRSQRGPPALSTLSI